MISHALTIVVNELEAHLRDAYGAAPPLARLGNLGEGVAGNGGATAAVPRDIVVFQTVNVREEKTLRNLPNQVRNDTTLRVAYENPPVFLNFTILVAATHTNYLNALLMLSRTIRFFQFRNVFEHGSVAPASLTTNAPANVLDQVETFRLAFELYSPSMEEVNHLWGTLGGKQLPFMLYTLRPLELKFRSIQAESGLITEVAGNFLSKDAVSA